MARRRAQHRTGPGRHLPGSSATMHEPVTGHPLHALSLGTWWIHITSVLEWLVAIVAIQTFGALRREAGWNWLAAAMLPALLSAMAACTWHFYDNPDALKGLVVLQAGCTALGNVCLAAAAWGLLRRYGPGGGLSSGDLGGVRSQAGSAEPEQPR